MTLPLYYNWRNLFVRKLTTLLTVAVIAVVVAALIVLLSFGTGMQRSVGGSGHPANLLVLNAGATAESTSLIWPEDARLLVQTPGAAVGPDGQPLVSLEVVVQTDVRRLRDSSSANVAVRGVDEAGFLVHDQVRIRGRAFRQGAREAIVGRAAQSLYRGLNIGDRISLGRSRSHEYEIVGVFESAGSAFESEIWAPRTMIADSYQRRFDSSAVIRLGSADLMTTAADYVNGPAVRLKATSEPEYYRQLSDQSQQVVYLVLGLVIIMATGAVFAVANTMYAAVDGRRREIAMLRTLGFSRLAIVAAFLVEAAMIAGLACLVGIAASLPFSGLRRDFLSNVTHSVTGFEIVITPGICLAALAAALLVGVIGAAAPSARAARTPIVRALRRG